MLCCCSVSSVVSESVWPQRRQPTRLPLPWDSPGKNTGVGCHFLLQCMKVKSESEVSQPCLTLHDPMDCSPPGSSIHGVFQGRGLEWGAIAFSVPHALRTIISSPSLRASPTDPFVSEHLHTILQPLSTNESWIKCNACCFLPWGFSVWHLCMSRDV